MSSAPSVLLARSWCVRGVHTECGHGLYKRVHYPPPHHFSFDPHGRRCHRPTTRHDEAVQPPGYDAAIAHLELPAFRRARRVVENAFGIPANRFQVLLSTMQQQPETVKLIVTACMLLHNLMRTRYPGMQNQQLDRAENLGRDYVPGA